MYYEKNNCLEQEIRIIQGNALNLLIPDEVTVFYLFNPFFDEKTYFNWFCKVKEGIDRNRRKSILMVFWSMICLKNCHMQVDRVKLWGFPIFGKPVLLNI